MNNGSGICVAALICGLLGIISVFTSALPILTWFLFVAAILGIVFGAVGMSKSKVANGSASGLAIAGLILGIIGCVFGFIGVICASSVCVTFGPMGCMDPRYQTLAGWVSGLL